MLYNYEKEEMRPIRILLDDDRVVEGEFIDLRIAEDSLPEGKAWFQLRHRDNDDMDIASLKKGCVVVNFFGTVISDPMMDILDDKEIPVTDWTFTD